VNFKNVYQTARKRPPFGIAQIGKSFRNEITPGNFTFRVREFEQAELEYFVPDDGNDVRVYEEWVAARKKWYSDYGVREDRLRFYELTPAERPHYAKAGTDVEYLFPWGWGELESIAHRGTYDLDAHMKLSGKDLRYFDEATKAHYTPILIESSAGMDRTTLTMLIDAYENETIVDPESGKETKRVVLRFHPKIAPVQVGVFPLARNKPDLVERAQRIERGLRPFFRTQYDEGNVGQLYRRQDEIGTPACIMIDYETLTDGSVTVRDRDTMRQDRLTEERLAGYLADRLGLP
jgi:glycyl-tRNA synthetase